MTIKGKDEYIFLSISRVIVFPYLTVPFLSLSLLFFSLLILTSIHVLSIDVKEFSKLLVKIKKKDHHHSDGWELTKRIVVITWAAALRHEAVLKGVIAMNI